MVNWIRNNNPNETSSYLVSMSLKNAIGSYTFMHVAHYDSDSNKWYRFDPFDSEAQIKEEISIIAWTDEAIVTIN